MYIYIWTCCAIGFSNFPSLGCDEVAEWLRRWTANPMGSARVGSNPILVVILIQLRLCFNFTFTIHHSPPTFPAQESNELRKEKKFRYRESNPGLLGESQLS